MNGGCLRDALDETAADGVVDWVQMIQYCHDAASGMAYLHGQKIVHRDIKSNNLLVRGPPPFGFERSNLG
jgi:serine/threonine protein kinase